MAVQENFKHGAQHGFAQRIFITRYGSVKLAENI